MKPRSRTPEGGGVGTGGGRGSHKLNAGVISKASLATCVVFRDQKSQRSRPQGSCPVLKEVVQVLPGPFAQRDPCPAWPCWLARETLCPARQQPVVARAGLTDTPLAKSHLSLCRCLDGRLERGAPPDALRLPGGQEGTPNACRPCGAGTHDLWLIRPSL